MMSTLTLTALLCGPLAGDQTAALAAAQRALLQKDWAGAQAALEPHAGDPEARFWLGYAYLRQGDAGNAVRLLAPPEDAGGAVPAARWHYYHGRAQAASGDDRQAADAFRTVTLKHPDSPLVEAAARQWLELAFFALQEHAETVQAADRLAALSGDPDSQALAAYAAGYSLNRLGEFAKAVPWTERLAAIESPVREARRQILVAQAQVMQGRADAADTLVAGLMNDFPDHPALIDPVVDATGMLLDAGQPVPAFRLLVMATQSRQIDDFRAYDRLLDMLVSVARDTEDAVMTLTELHRKNDRPIALRLLARRKLLTLTAREAVETDNPDLLRQFAGEMTRVMAAETDSQWAVAQNALLVSELYADHLGDAERAVRAVGDARRSVGRRRDLQLLLDDEQARVRGR